jgi:hypothetical protein
VCRWTRTATNRTFPPKKCCGFVDVTPRLSRFACMFDAMGPDAKWLDILKATGWQFGCLAVAAWLAVVADKNGWLPVALDPLVKQGTMLAAIAFTGLWVATIGSTTTKWTAVPVEKFKRWNSLRTHAKAFESYIPHMTIEERRIFAQLLHENRKSFTAAHDGGYAGTLLGRRFISILAVQGQAVSYEDVPFGVPDHIWDIAVKHKADFPYKPNRDGMDAWRVHWMAR